jgi:pimeloyl-ACP methyl ester carboxylesterase
VVPALQPLPIGDQQYWATRQKRIRTLGATVPADTPRVTYAFVEELARCETGDSRYISLGYARASDGPMSDTARAQWRRLLQQTTALADFSNRGALCADEIARITAPVLLIYGAHSPYLPTSARLRKLLNNCKELRLAGVGHLYPLTRPLDFSAYLRSFIECHESARQLS